MQHYNDYNSYLKSKYGTKVYRIGLDAGFSCPNRDGTIGYGGCLYCNADGSRSLYTKKGMPVRSQLEDRMTFLKKAKGAKKFIAYFQAFTNTHGPTDKLKSAYDQILPYGDIVGLVIGTRPDSVNREKLELIASYRNRYEVWIEYGLQSIREDTLRYLNRGHSAQDFFRSVKDSKSMGMPVCAHVIIGLPGETASDVVKTARALSAAKVDGVKIHVLHILKGSRLEEEYRNGRVRVLEQDEYAGLVSDFLENLSEDILIHRLTGQGKREDHIAPLWALDKIGTINKIKKTLQERHTHQGFKTGPLTPSSKLLTKS